MIVFVRNLLVPADSEEPGWNGKEREGVIQCLFDTNVVHKIEMSGAEPRLLISLEFHPHGKVPGLWNDKSLPCPARKKDFSRPELTRNKSSWHLGL